MRSAIKMTIRFARSKGSAVLLYALSSVMLPPAVCAIDSPSSLKSFASSARFSFASTEKRSNEVQGSDSLKVNAVFYA
jgi:hypothetical protein